MTEKNYGGANSFGMKDKNIKDKQGSIDVKVTDKKMKSKAEVGGLSEEQLECYLKAGEISKKVDSYLHEIVKKDVLLLEIAEKVESKIEELGGKIAFPTNLSIDENAAHYTPIVRDTSKAEGLLKVDFGVEVEGFIADRAISFDLTDDKRYMEMIKLNELVLESVLKELEIGSPLKIVGNTIAGIVEKDGRFKVIRNLAGHGLDKDNIHPGLTVSNLKNENEFELNNVAIAIEPFLTEGRGEIYEGKPSEIYVLQQKKTPRDRNAREMLDFIERNYKTKPFCKRWLEKVGLKNFNFSLSVLVKEGILYNFPVLIEKEKKPVSQAEHTVVFADKVYVTTK